ncbi:hypothetical protein KGM_212931 [Danaus plexippus plexippus]|uniref:Uncharacterized protein n=1 Tax=Danaus plexippus plexippus TaxID=278856 RepID=A0A212FH05_DANPL|nr:hypothetical protein KGM_212931 [Danaus plexippus plexippus]
MTEKNSIKSKCVRSSIFERRNLNKFSSQITIHVANLRLIIAIRFRSYDDFKKKKAPTLGRGDGALDAMGTEKNCAQVTAHSRDARSDLSSQIGGALILDNYQLALRTVLS